MSRPQLMLKTLISCALIAGCALSWTWGWAQINVELTTGSLKNALVTYEGAEAGNYGLRRNASLEDILDIKCSERDALEIDTSHVSIIGKCGRLSWQINFVPYPEGRALAFDQMNFFSEQGPWWLVNETSSILRESKDKARPDISFALNGNPIEARAGSARLPAWHQAPGFWLLGDPAFLDKGIMRHYFDVESVPIHLIDVLERHERGIRFLHSALPVRSLSPVFWMGLNEWQASLGGAAGTGLILANYPAKAIELDDVGRAFALYVVLHEHAHQAVHATGVLWIDESLVSFLAIKAVKETSPSLYRGLADAFIEPGQSADSSLQVLGARAAAGDDEAYAQLYQGAAFWNALDDTISKQESQLGVLPLLPEMLASAFSPTGSVKFQEMARITRISRNELREILDTYLALDS